MTEAQRLSADIIAWDLDNRIQGEPFQDYEFPLAQTDGAQAALPALLTVRHPVVTAARCRELRGAPESSGSPNGRSHRRGPAYCRGKTPSAKVHPTGRDPQIDSFLSTSAAQNPLVVTFAERMRRVKELPAPKQEELRAAAEKITAEQVYPAWRKAKALLEAEVPKAGDDAGIVEPSPRTGSL